jgi:DNA mismatch repair ATPase MutL
MKHQQINDVYNYLNMCLKCMLHLNCGVYLCSWNQHPQKTAIELTMVLIHFIYTSMNSLTTIIILNLAEILLA